MFEELCSNTLLLGWRMWWYIWRNNYLAWWDYRRCWFEPVVSVPLALWHVVMTCETSPVTTSCHQVQFVSDAPATEADNIATQYESALRVHFQRRVTIIILYIFWGSIRQLIEVQAVAAWSAGVSDAEWEVMFCSKRRSGWKTCDKRRNTGLINNNRRMSGCFFNLTTDSTPLLTKIQFYLSFTQRAARLNDWN